MFAGLRLHKYRAIYADPPWRFLTRSENGKERSPERHYDCMSFSDICAMPVSSMAANDCALFLWVTDPLLDKGLELVNAWGFTFKTVAFSWAKLNPSAHPRFWSPSDFFTGMGYWTRANSELCLLATRGTPKRQHMDVRRLVVSHRREHSRKPDEVADRITRLVSGPYLELFARTRRAGWDVAGNQCDLFPMRNP